MTISKKYGRYELPHELLNDLRLRMFGKYEVLRRSQIFINYSVLLSLPPKTKILSIQVKNCSKIEIGFSCSALFHTSTKVCLIYFGQDCLWKKYFASNSPQSPSNLICFSMLVTIRA